MEGVKQSSVVSLLEITMLPRAGAREIVEIVELGKAQTGRTLSRCELRVYFNIRSQNKSFYSYNAMSALSIEL